jgi:hypothetical protein
MNYIPIIALGIVLHFIGAVITAAILLKVTEHDPKPEYPDEERCIELESFLWEFVLIIYLLLAIILSPYWLGRLLHNNIQKYKFYKDE